MLVHKVRKIHKILAQFVKFESLHYKQLFLMLLNAVQVYVSFAKGAVALFV